MIDHFRQLTKRQRLLLGIAIVVLIIALAWWVRSFFSHRGAVEAALRHFDEAQSYHAVAEFKAVLPVRINNRERPFHSVLARIDGDVKENESGTPEFTGKLYTELEGRGAKFFADGDMRIFNEGVAFRLANLPLLFNPSGSLLRRWTHVDAKLLQTRNGDELRQLVPQIAQDLRYLGRDDLDGEAHLHFKGTIPAELEASLITAAQHAASNNHGWNIIARLLNVYDVRTIEAWIDPGSKELRKLAVAFGQKKDNRFATRAVVQLSFSEYGKAVTLEQPPRQLRVSPQVFTRIFRTGQITPQQ